jgi:hypothetical protein
MKRTENEKGSLLRELAAILRDYQERIDRIGPEAFRLRGEAFEAWDRKRQRIALVLTLLEEAAEVLARHGTDEDLEVLAREVARAPDVPVPVSPGTLQRLVEADVASLRGRVARLHREHPEKCPGAGCPCRTEQPEVRP